MSDGMEERQAHWDGVYAAKGEREVSWFQENPADSLDLIARAGLAPGASVVDIGAGASRLVDALVRLGFDVTALDLSAAALATAKARLGPAGAGVRWIAADITTWRPDRAFDLWHDRAAFHFLTDAGDRARYLERLKAGLKPGGHALIATFAPDGPEKCSGLPVVRYDPDSLAAALGGDFRLVASARPVHATPWGATQAFQFSLFRRA